MVVAQNKKADVNIKDCRAMLRLDIGFLAASVSHPALRKECPSRRNVDNETQQETSDLWEAVQRLVTGGLKQDIISLAVAALQPCWSCGREVKRVHNHP